MGVVYRFMVDFKEAIRNFQLQGDREIIDRIMQRIDEVHFFYRQEIKESELPRYFDITVELPEDYIALRILKVLAHLFLYTEKQREEFEKCLRQLSNEEWLLIDEREVFKGNYQSILENPELKRYLGDGWASVSQLIETVKSLRDINQQSRKIEGDIRESVIKALEDALKRVDISEKRTDKEIVKYVGLVWYCKFSDYEILRNGLRRIEEKGRTYIVKPYYGDPLEMIFNRDINIVGGYRAIKKYLMKKQRELIEKVLKIIKDDIKNNRLERFHFDKTGKAYLNKRRFAEALDMEETNFKHKLRRIEQRLDLNWGNILDDVRGSFSDYYAE